MRFARGIEQACFGISVWIFLRQVCKGEKISREEEARHRLRIARRVSKTMVEASPTRAADMGNYAVHHLAALFVSVEVLVNKVPQKASALRDSHSANALHPRGSLRIVFQIGKKIAHRSQPYAHHHRILCGIHNLVNLAGQESAV